jgi:hypothetical protein
MKETLPKATPNNLSSADKTIILLKQVISREGTKILFVNFGICEVFFSINSNGYWISVNLFHDTIEFNAINDGEFLCKRDHVSSAKAHEAFNIIKSACAKKN